MGGEKRRTFQKHTEISGLEKSEICQEKKKNPNISGLKVKISGRTFKF